MLENKDHDFRHNYHYQHSQSLLHTSSNNIKQLLLKQAVNRQNFESEIPVNLVIERAKLLNPVHNKPTLLTSQKESTLPYPTPEFELTSEPDLHEILRTPTLLDLTYEPILDRSINTIVLPHNKKLPGKHNNQSVSIELLDKFQQVISRINIVLSGVISRFEFIRITLRVSTQ